MEKVNVTIDNSARPANYSVNIVNRDLAPVKVTVAAEHQNGTQIKPLYTANKGKSPFPFVVLETAQGKVKLFGENAEQIAEHPIEWHKDADGRLVSAISIVDGEMSYYASMVEAEAETAPVAEEVEEEVL